MARKLVVSIKNITEEQRNMIREAAAEAGWTAEFFEKEKDALEAARDAEVVFADSARYAFDAPKLKWICSPSAGVDHFTGSRRFRESGVMLSNSSGAYGVTIAEHIVMVTLIMLRRLPEYQEKVADKKWYRGFAIRSIKNSRVTVIGTGDIGRETAKRFRAFSPTRITGVNTSGMDDSGSFDEVIGADKLEAILPKTDILIMAIPGTAETRHLMDADRLRLLPEGALIVNVGRGSTIEEDALIAELKAGRLRAALDVFTKEPLDIDSEVWDCPNLLITPHVAGDMLLPYTVERIVGLFLEDFKRYVRGEMPERAVDINKGY
ncbi:MAG: D-2-hydroxyacid dehydrogenase [Firmicutes bacterium]|nr:D-2-hydroxyacid dehydrogenase [Bacillota bacterium]